MFNLFLTNADATEPTNPFGIIMLIVIIVAFAALLIVSRVNEKKRQKENQETLAKIKVGDRVKTVGGVCGFIAEIRREDNTFVLETGLDDKKSYVRFDMGYIYQTAPNTGKDENVKETTVEEKVEEKSEEKETAKAPAKKTAKKPATKKEN